MPCQILTVIQQTIQISLRSHTHTLSFFFFFFFWLRFIDPSGGDEWNKTERNRQFYAKLVWFKKNTFWSWAWNGRKLKYNKCCTHTHTHTVHWHKILLCWINWADKLYAIIIIKLLKFERKNSKQIFPNNSPVCWKIIKTIYREMTQILNDGRIMKTIFFCQKFWFSITLWANRSAAGIRWDTRMLCTREWTPGKSQRTSHIVLISKIEITGEAL